MDRTVRDQLWIVLAASVVFFTNLSATGLWDLDEPLYASVAREMLERHDWVVPRYNGEYFFDKPPLMFWTMMLGSQCFANQELGVRFIPAVLGILTALATYHIGRRLFRREVGLWAGIAMSSTLFFTVSARAATVDAALTLASTLAVLLFVFAGYADVADEPAANTAGDGQGDAAARRWPVRQWSPWIDWLFFVGIYAMMGVAVLGKGPVGLLLPLAAIGLFSLIVHQAPLPARPRATTWFKRAGRVLQSAVRPLAPLNFVQTTWRLRPLTAAVVLAAVALPWFVLVDLRSHGQWLGEFFGKYNLRPFTQPFLGHSGPFFYHFVAVLIGFFPWSVFLAPSLAQAFVKLRAGGREGRATLLMACWIGVWFGFWSICSTKLPHYVLPAYPAIAILTGVFLADWLAAPAAFTRVWWRNATITLMLVGIGLLVALPIVAMIFVPGEEVIGMVGLLLVIGGGICWWLQREGHYRKALVGFAGTSVLFVTAVFAFVAVRIDQHQHSKPLLAAIRATGEQPPIAAFRFLQASMVYYAGHSIPRLDSPEAVKEFLGQNPNACILTSDRAAAEIDAKMPQTFDVLARRPRFLGRGEVLVLRSAARSPDAANALQAQAADAAQRK